MTRLQLFPDGRKNGDRKPGEKASRQEREPTHLTGMTLSPGIEFGPQRWEASAFRLFNLVLRLRHHRTIPFWCY